MKNEKEYYKDSHTVECYTCNFKGTLRLYKRLGSIFFENPSRFNIIGNCPKCDTNLINVNITIKD